MKHAYDKDRATKLVPLLEVIFREVVERRREARLLEKMLARVKREDPESPDAGTLRGRLADHRRELRLARKEFERLGCVVDDDNPTRVIIPGHDGGLERGFSWSAGDSHVHPVAG